MVSGAVFIDQDEVGEVDEVNSSEQESSSDLTDPDEDAIMEQVVMASQRKNELMRSVLKLQDEAVEGISTHLSDESNIKPSVLRKLSHGSALMHFANIADMKKRKSLTESELKNAIAEEDETEIEPVIKKNSVAILSDMFLSRSRKHVRDYARRRTLDDERYTKKLDFESRDAIIPNTTLLKTDNPESITEIPEHGLKLEIASKSEKVLRKVKPQYPRFRQYGRKIGRSASVKVSRTYDKEKSDDELSNNSFEALNLETPEHFKYNMNNGPDDEFCVADLVHFHDKIIRGNSFPCSISPSRELFVNETESENSEKLYHVLVRGKLTGIRNSNFVKRVQSFPGMKRRKTLEDGTEARAPEPSPRDAAECKSLPASPNSIRKPVDGDLVKSDYLVYLSMSDTERALNDVKSIVNTFETQKLSDEEIVRKNSTGERTKEDKDLRSFDDVFRSIETDLKQQEDLRSVDNEINGDEDLRNNEDEGLFQQDEDLRSVDTETMQVDKLRSIENEGLEQEEDLRSVDEL